MKIYNFPQISAVGSRVKERDGDKQEGAGKNAYQQNKKDQQKKDDQPSEFQVQVEDVQNAIEALNHTEVETGVHAAAEGDGPGLKVKLTDGAGGILRTVSGEEFLKLREAITGGKVPGKILDKKAY